ncbi:unnamed protein product [Effrenium voratum]|uniref:DUF1499 domain-containing protein n=1 Tax=Effrenium voratum TaxID=2562239 RepID=A0AA36IYC0_9DINO|nr:unnamed protein product [Effrenium voratum]CAJ1423410.1 unnamed protein product [Effrenium voratum]
MAKEASARSVRRLVPRLALLLFAFSCSRCFLASRRALVGLALAPHAALAFENRVREVKGPKSPGSQPAGVGQGTLAGCKAAPNCFSSAAEDEHYLKPWSFPGPPEKALADLEQVLKAYPPGQQDIDGGGFQIQKLEPKGYIYVQFESLKKGYIDDVEFRVQPVDSESQVLVRSASRLGYLDLGVNAKRLNWISQRLRDRGWAAPKITAELFPRYASENR